MVKHLWWLDVYSSVKRSNMHRVAESLMTSRELPVSIAVHATISIWPWCICLWNIFIRSGDFVIFEITYAAAAILDFHDNWIWHVNRHDGCLFLELCYIGLRIISVSVCLSLIILYCLTHVECFRFFDLAAIVAAPKLHTTTAVHATTIRHRHPFCEK